MDKHLGIAVENFESSSHEKLLKQGMLCELIFCNSIANEKQSTSCADMFLEQTENGTFPMSNWTPGTAQGQGLASHRLGGGPAPPASTTAAARAASVHHLLSVSGSEDGSNEFDLAAEALRFLYHLRKCVIHSARRLLTRHYNLLDRETYASLSRPWKTIAWHALSPFFPTLSPALHMYAANAQGSGPGGFHPLSQHQQSSSSSLNDYHGSPQLTAAPTPTKNSSHLRAMKSPHKEALKAVRAQEMEVLQAGPGAAVVVRNMFHELRSSHISTEVTLSLATNLRFASNTLKNEGVVLESSDLFVRLLRAAEVWLELFEAFGNAHTECEISFHFLRVLLPSLGNANTLSTVLDFHFTHHPSPYFLQTTSSSTLTSPCFSLHLLPPLSLAPVFVKSTELGLQMMQLCGRALQRLLYGLFGGTEPSRDILDLVKSSSFTLLRAAAQEQLARQRSFTR